MTYSLHDRPFTTQHYLADMTQPPQNWPRIKDLPEKERKPFSTFLYGQTRPLIDGVPMEEQDAYYSWDYENFKRKPENRFFD